ncbi:MAG: hypothetical protein M0Q95_15275 [Porticoccaceae bacterium]|nr:hypothetical protein [Porticoccaceae bacterium]
MIYTNKFLWLIIIISIFIGGCSRKYSFEIKNKSHAPIKVYEVSVDDKSIFSGKETLFPQEKKYSANNALRASFFSRSPHKLKITFSLVNSQEKKILQCDLDDRNESGCVFVIRVWNLSNLTCFCDSFSDAF